MLSCLINWEEWNDNVLVFVEVLEFDEIEYICLGDI